METDPPFSFNEYDDTLKVDPVVKTIFKDI